MYDRLARAIAIAGTLIATPLWADLRLITELDLDVPPQVGGLSGIEMDETGMKALLLSDRGTLFSVNIARGEDGAATGLDITRTQRLRHNGEHRHPDSEGLARLNETQFAISTEDPTRLLVYTWGNKDPVYRPSVITKRPLDDNRGFEALAITPDGALLTVFETPDGEAFPTYVFEDETWRMGPNIPAHPNFSIVGADFDAEGRLYILERAFSALGFRSQVRRLSFDDKAVRENILLTTKLGRFDNLEGIAVWTDADGQTLLTLVSDNNNLRMLRMTLVEFLLPE